MVLRNICPTGIVNGTICVVRGIIANVLQLQVFTGPSRGDDFYLHRVPIITQAASGTGFRMRRLQFPISVAFDDRVDDQQVPGPDQELRGSLLAYTRVKGLAVLMPSKCWRPVESYGMWSTPRHYPETSDQRQQQHDWMEKSPGMSGAGDRTPDHRMVPDALTN
ncbi:hypothetical protein GWK47_043163 [Chionoecetes opilio]|uniref:Uncharacterized protein n=1 Tax=Chionoecetes opilio TaxID=41210 RepID=A0A8J4YGG1_CHIOP|nr:hypothetical protein GWK47_043163 [Chionoecetes opilio]